MREVVVDAQDVEGRPDLLLVAVLTVALSPAFAHIVGYQLPDAGWLTCEERVEGPLQGWSRRHGYTFYVPASAERARTLG